MWWRVSIAVGYIPGRKSWPAEADTMASPAAAGCKCCPQGRKSSPAAADSTASTAVDTNTAALDRPETCSVHPGTGSSGTASCSRSSRMPVSSPAFSLSFVPQSSSGCGWTPRLA
uniref:(northern house mosquito) hypothetical protein n=1 Tax=Culex pipiens TaxID=7175 RepID=A0A8D8LFM5_CULPI